MFDNRNIPIQQIQAEPLPKDYVERAEQVIIELREMNRRNQRNAIISTSKLRSLLTLFTGLFNEVYRENREKLSEDQINVISAAKVRIFYEVGREEGYNGSLESGSVGRFVKSSHLLSYLYDIGDSCEAMVQFYRYMEALVAFHRFHLGEIKDKR